MIVIEITLLASQQLILKLIWVLFQRKIIIGKVFVIALNIAANINAKDIITVVMNLAVE